MQYKVVAIYNLNQITPETNIVTVNVIGQEIEKLNPQKNIINTRSSSLFQNYPNPFNPSTQIRFSINQSSFVTLKIYNILGRVIITLVNDNRQPGDYTVNFDGSGLTSGIYFYKIQTEDFSVIKKMILMK